MLLKNWALEEPVECVLMNHKSFGSGLNYICASRVV